MVQTSLDFHDGNIRTLQVEISNDELCCRSDESAISEQQEEAGHDPIGREHN